MSLEGTSITPLGSGAASIPPNTSQQLPDTSETARSQGNASPADANAGKPGEEALEWAQVIELRAFGERKAWIEEKTRVRHGSFYIIMCLLNPVILRCYNACRLLRSLLG